MSRPSPTQSVSSEGQPPRRSSNNSEGLDSDDDLPFFWVAKRREQEHFEVDFRCWRRFTPRDEASLEAAYLIGSQEAIPVEQGRYMVNLKTMTSHSVYWEEPVWPVMRSSWFWRPNYSTDLGVELISNSWSNDTSPPTLPPLPVDPYLCPFGPCDCELLEGAFEELRRELDSGPIDCELEDTPEHSKSIVQFTVTEKKKSAKRSTTPSSLPEPLTLDDYVIEHALYDTAKRLRLQVYRGYPVVEEPPADDDIPEDSPVWLCFLIHGIGEMLYNRGHVPEIGAPRCRSHCWRYRQLFGEKLKEDLNVTQEGVPARIELIPIEWGLSVHDSALDDQLESITLTSCGRVRTFANLAISDAFLYSQPARREGILDYVMRQKYHLFCQNNPTFHPDVLSGRSAVCILGHSLGSVIGFDLLARQPPPESGEESSAPRKSTTNGSTGHTHAGAAASTDDDLNGRGPESPNGHVEASNPVVSDDFQLPFCPRVLFLLGSPLGLFLTIRNELLPGGALPTCRRVFNIFHPNDCVAYRVEPLVAPELSEVPPMYIPHRGGHRLHVAVKRLHSDVGSAFSNVGSTISRWFADPTQEKVREHTLTGHWVLPTKGVKQFQRNV